MNTTTPTNTTTCRHKVGTLVDRAEPERGAICDDCGARLAVYTPKDALIRQANALADDASADPVLLDAVHSELIRRSHAHPVTDRADYRVAAETVAARLAERAD